MSHLRSKKAHYKASAESNQDRLGRIRANVSLAFSLPTLCLGFCTFRSASELFSLALRRPSKLIYLLPCGLTDIFYFSAKLL
jgi:hypothetical protein